MPTFPPPPLRLCERRGLSHSNRALVRAVAEALLSDADEDGRPTPPRPELIDRVTTELDYSIGAGSAELRRGFGVLCSLVDRLPPVVIGRMTRATNLPLPERILYLRTLEHSRVGLMGTLLVGLKIPLTLAAYDTGPELAHTGYERATLQEPRGDGPIEAPRPWGRASCEEVGS